MVHGCHRAKAMGRAVRAKRLPMEAEGRELDTVMERTGSQRGEV